VARKLYLLRHGKSSWAESGVADFDRPLNQRGRAACDLIGRAMAERGYNPDLVLCSPSRRTRETLDRVLPHLKTAPSVAIVADLYEPPSRDYLPALARYGDTAAAILLVGHNPTAHATALALVGSGPASARKALAEKFPTAALAAIDFPSALDWQALSPGSGHLAGFLTPRLLGGDDDS